MKRTFYKKLSVFMIVCALCAIFAVAFMPKSVKAYSVSSVLDFTTDPTTAITEINKGKTLGCDDSTWDSTTKTLTLNGVSISGNLTCVLKLPSKTTIVLSDYNSFWASYSGAQDLTAPVGAIMVTEDVEGGYLNIKGDGTLNVEACDISGRSDSETNPVVAGMLCYVPINLSEKAVLTVEGGFNVGATSAGVLCTGVTVCDTASFGARGGLTETYKSNAADCYGLDTVSLTALSGDHKVTITDSGLFNACTWYGSGNSYALYTKEFNSNGGDSSVSTITTEYISSQAKSYGMKIDGAFNMTGGEVKITSSTGATERYAILVNGNITVAGGTLKIEGNNAFGFTGATDKIICPEGKCFEAYGSATATSTPSTSVELSSDGRNFTGSGITSVGSIKLSVGTALAKVTYTDGGVEKVVQKTSASDALGYALELSTSATSTAKVTLLADCVLSSYVSMASDYVVIDLNGFTIDRGLADTTGQDTGYCFIVNGGELTIEDSSEAKTGTITGGYVNKASVSTKTPYFGGCIRITGGGKVTLNSGTITGNKAAANGGAISIKKTAVADESAGTFIMNGGAITNNIADSEGLESGLPVRNNYGYGGAIYGYWGSTIIINGGEISSNVGGSGGAIYVMGSDTKGVSTLTISNATFKNNIAYQYGGAVDIEYASCSITSSTFKDNRLVSTNFNTSSVQGAAVYVYVDDLSLAGKCVFDHNYVGTPGSEKGNLDLSISNPIKLSEDFSTDNPISLSGPALSSSVTQVQITEATTKDYLSSFVSPFGLAVIKQDGALYLTKGYTVTFNVGGKGTAPTSQTITSGTATKPTDPTYTGYAFKGWYNEAACTTEFDFTKSVTANVIAYAKWEKEKYNITFNLNGGESELVNGAFLYGADTSAFEATKVGSTFIGFYLEDNITSSMIQSDILQDLGDDGANVTLYAQYIKESYYYTFDTNGGQDMVINQIHAEYGQTLTALPDPTHATLFFAGWNTKADGTGDEFILPKTMPDLGDNMATVVLYAKWISSFQVSFNLNGADGTAPESQLVSPGEVATAPEADPVYAKHVFMGWYKESECTNAVDFSEVITEARVYYAKWVKYVEVSFDLNGGVGTTPNTQSFAPGESATAPLEVPTLTGYKFTGWYQLVEEALSTTAFDFTSKVNEDIKICAGYKKEAYTLKIEVNGGVGTAGDVKVEFGELMTDSTFPALTKEGNTIAGWYIKDGNSILYSNLMGDDDNTVEDLGDDGDVITVYPSWRKEVYILSFNTNGGSSLSTLGVHYGDRVALPETKKEGYTLVGWFTDSALTKMFDINVADLGKDTEQVTLYAKWAEVTGFSITGKVVDKTGKGLNLAMVQLKAGSTYYATLSTDSNGNFTVTGLDARTYQLVSVYGGVIVTNVINLSESLTGYVVTMPNGSLNSIVEVNNDVPEVIVEGLDKEFSSSDETQASSGNTSIELKLTVETEEASASLTSASKSYKIGLTLDINIVKTSTVDGIEGTPSNVKTTSNLITITIPLPTELQGKKNYEVLREHEGSVDVITTKANANGEYIEVSQDKTELIIHVKNFSLYSIAYKNGSLTWLWIILIILILIGLFIVYWLYKEKGSFKGMPMFFYGIWLVVANFFIFLYEAVKHFFIVLFMKKEKKEEKDNKLSAMTKEEWLNVERSELEMLSAKGKDLVKHLDKKLNKSKYENEKAALEELKGIILLAPQKDSEKQKELLLTYYKEHEVESVVLLEKDAKNKPVSLKAFGLVFARIYEDEHELKISLRVSKEMKEEILKDYQAKEKAYYPYGDMWMFVSQTEAKKIEDYYGLLVKSFELTKALYAPKEKEEVEPVKE